MNQNRTILAIMGILIHALLIVGAVAAWAAFCHFVWVWPYGKVGIVTAILGVIILAVAGLSIGGVRQNFGIFPLFMPLQKILTQQDEDASARANYFLVSNGFTIYVGLAGLITLVGGILIKMAFPG